MSDADKFRSTHDQPDHRTSDEATPDGEPSAGENPPARSPHHHTARPDHENRSSAEPTDGQPT